MLENIIDITDTFFDLVLIDEAESFILNSIQKSEAKKAESFILSSIQKSKAKKAESFVWPEGRRKLNLVFARFFLEEYKHWV